MNRRELLRAALAAAVGASVARFLPATDDVDWVTMTDVDQLRVSYSLTPYASVGDGVAIEPRAGWSPRDPTTGLTARVEVSRDRGRTWQPVTKPCRITVGRNAYSTVTVAIGPRDALTLSYV